MLKAWCQCLYCGEEWEQVFYGYKDDPRCSKCKDRRIKVRKRDTRKVDYYADDPVTSEVKADYGEFTD